jgi:hypothetical protein
LAQGTLMNIIMQRFAVVTMIFAPLTLVTGFFGIAPFAALGIHRGFQFCLCRMRFILHPIPGPSMNIDEVHGSEASCIRRID